MSASSTVVTSRYRAADSAEQTYTVCQKHVTTFWW